MHNPRYNRRILASTALALVLAVPLVSVAKNDDPSVPAAPNSVIPAATPAEQASTQAAPATAPGPTGRRRSPAALPPSLR